MAPRLFRICALTGATLAAALSAAGKTTVSVAAAANLVYALESLNAEFARPSPEITVEPTTGASGNLFAQLKHGAPFDVFLSADAEYPRAIVHAGLGDPKTLKTFAIGRLVLWTTRADVELSDP